MLEVNSLHLILDRCCSNFVHKLCMPPYFSIAVKSLVFSISVRFLLRQNLFQIELTGWPSIYFPGYTYLFNRGTLYLTLAWSSAKSRSIDDAKSLQKQVSELFRKQRRNVRGSFWLIPAHVSTLYVLITVGLIVRYNCFRQALAISLLARACNDGFLSLRQREKERERVIYCSWERNDPW